MISKVDKYLGVINGGDGYRYYQTLSTKLTCWIVFFPKIYGDESNNEIERVKVKLVKEYEKNMKDKK